MGQVFLAVVEELDALTKMWLSFLGIGLMVLAAVVITFARTLKRRWLRIVLAIIAVLLLLIGMLYAFFAIMS